MSGNPEQECYWTNGVSYHIETQKCFLPIDVTSDPTAVEEARLISSEYTRDVLGYWGLVAALPLE